MSKGLSLHIGVDHVDTSHYGNITVLQAAKKDADFWEKFAGEQGYKTKKLVDGTATTASVLAVLADYASQLQPGDIFLLTYAGHGSEVPNEKAAGDDEVNDQTWCLYDRQLLDDEIYDAFRAFKEGVRIVVVSDSCHSRTITKDAGLNLNTLLCEGFRDASLAGGSRSRKLSRDEQKAVWRAKKGEYETIQKKYKRITKGKDVKASVKLLAACQDDEETLDGEHNGIFTEAFINIFNNPDARNFNCEMLIAAVRERYYFPKPDFFQYGGIIDAFDDGFPFTINIANAAKVTGYRKPDLSFARPKPRGMVDPRAEAGIVETFEPSILLIETDNIDFENPAGGTDVEVVASETRNGLKSVTVKLPEISHQFAWSAAHALQTKLRQAGITATVEPVLTINPGQRPRLTREGDASNPDYIKEWPPSLQQGVVGIGWHLDDTHSQLTKAAKAALGKGGAHVRVGHIDTGYREGHIGLPTGLNRGLARSFIKGEVPSQAIDEPKSGGQEGHGLGTICLLAGASVTKNDTFGEFEGYVGGVPFAEIVPMRVSESVAIFNDRNFCDAVEYAIDNKCEVISMSMAGKPSKRMARAVNNAYKSGIVMVTAASNCWYKGIMSALPKCVLFPAAFERVIAATGAMYDHKPYDVKFLQQARFAIGTKYMQGCWGPAARMKKALAAYTPNTPWASDPIKFLRSGGGTSSATPQIAAAAAIWIAYHREKLEEKGYYKEGHQWKKVEAVRKALFDAAAKDTLFGEWEKYYGNGILKAYDALQVGVADESALKEAADAEASWFGIVELVSSFFLRRRRTRATLDMPQQEALANELVQLLQTDPQFYALYSELDLADPVQVGGLMNSEQFYEQVQQSPYASVYLKEAL